MNYEEEYTELVDRILVILQCLDDQLDRAKKEGKELLYKLCKERCYELDDKMDIISCSTCNDYINWAIVVGDKCHSCGETWKYNAY